MTTVPLDAALRPLAQALLSAAEGDAARVTAQTARTCAELLAQARGQAEAILAEARAQGRADAEAVRAAAQARARRDARDRLLRTQRAVYEELRVRCREAAAAIPAEPGYAALRDRLADAARRTLGDGAVVRDADGGGVIGEAAGRRMDLSLAGFADRAVADLAWQLFDGDAAAGGPS